MRHFSGDLDGLRLLMADELEQIAGGDGEDTDGDPEPPPPHQLEDIIVTGGVTAYNLDLGQLFHFYNVGQNPTGGAWTGGGLNPPDCNITQVEWDNPAVNNANATSELATRFSGAIEEQSDRVRAIPDSLTIYYPGTSTVFTTGPELRALWAKSDFVVTGLPQQQGYGGTADHGNGNPVLTVDINQLPGYMSSTASQAWYFFHELAHTTVEGAGMNREAQNAWAANSEGVSYASSSYFAHNERAMNTIAANIASLFGIDVKAGYTPGFGYLLSGYETHGASSLTPNTAGYGPGGSC